MKMSCPACGSSFSLDVLLANESAREAVLSALALPAPLGKLLISYIALFRPAQRQLSFDRVARLLDELRGPISDARIERNGRIWPAPQETWKAALSEMLALRDQQKLRLPLASHGYLFEIIASQADKQQGVAERAREEKLRRAPELPPASLPDRPTCTSSQTQPAAQQPFKRSVVPESFKQVVAGLGMKVLENADEKKPDETASDAN